MVQRKFYLPEEMYARLQLRAKIARKSISDILRELLDEGLKHKEKKQSGRGAKALLELARIAEKKGWSGPRDLSIKHNTYFVKTEKQKNK